MYYARRPQGMRGRKSDSVRKMRSFVCDFKFQNLILLACETLQVCEFARKVLSLEKRILAER